MLAAQESSGDIHSFHALKKSEHFSKIGNHEFYVMGYLNRMESKLYTAEPQATPEIQTQ